MATQNLQKRCLCCGAQCAVQQLTCHLCGEGSWAMIVVPLFKGSSYLSPGKAPTIELPAPAKAQPNFQRGPR